VHLSPARSERAVEANLGADGRIVVVGRGSDMSDPATTSSNALTETLGDVPVLVRVEVGVVEMRAREWSALAPGDVVTLGRNVADPVSLRAGGVEIARGELVEIEGEVGVRILSLSKDPA
jgi:flagellar motor switch/type III secretory pathway protein FliN